MLVRYGFSFSLSSITPIRRVSDTLKHIGQKHYSQKTFQTKRTHEVRSHNFYLFADGEAAGAADGADAGAELDGTGC